MESVALIYFVGMFVAVFTMRMRAGVGIWLRPKIFGPDGFGPVWAATTVVCGMAWPVTLAVWLARGRPEPRVVFNHKAEERLAAQRAAGRA